MRRVEVSSIGPAEVESPLWVRQRQGGRVVPFVGEDDWLRYEIGVDGSGVPRCGPEGELLFEKTGPRRKIALTPSLTRAAIVTCGGLSPGLNNVIRSLYLELRHGYGVPEVIGLRDGFRGLNPDIALPPIRLTTEFVSDIHKEGGTMLGTSRGPQDPAVMVGYLRREGINLLFCIGGDGTQRGSHAIVEEAARQGHRLVVVGIPKTIDNDLMYCDSTFGYQSAVEQASRVLHLAHTEARAGVNGLGLVKVMGRDSGFIACGATLVSQEVNFCLIPELKFRLEGPDGLLAALEERMDRREHAVVVVAEGAGQEMFSDDPNACDASGNKLHRDIGLLLKDRIIAHFRERGKPMDLKYIDPSYIIRSVAANSFDAVLCDQLARNSVHAAMAGKTDVLVCYHNNTFMHVPIPMATVGRKHVNLTGNLWNAVLSSTGQPSRLGV
jgi:6-phosphofructokinase 1